MTIKDLIEKLKEFDRDEQVKIESYTLAYCMGESERDYRYDPISSVYKSKYNGVLISG